MASLAIEFDCIEKILTAVASRNPQRPLFVPAYGVSNFVDVAIAMKKRLGGPAADAGAGGGFEIVGAQDFSVLGRLAAPAL